MRFDRIIMIFLAVAVISATPVFAVEKNIQTVTSETLKANGKTLLNVFTNAADEGTYQRKKTGLQVVGFLLIYVFIMWRVKRKVWKNVHKNNTSK